MAKVPAQVVETLAILCIFLAHGKTFTFRNLMVESDNEYAITFTYTAMSDGATKRATFYKANMAGISKTE